MGILTEREIAILMAPFYLFDGTIISFSFINFICHRLRVPGVSVIGPNPIGTYDRVNFGRFSIARVKR